MLAFNRIQPLMRAGSSKLNQSHMSPTESARGRHTGLKDRARQRGWKVEKALKEGWKTGKEKRDRKG